MAKTASQVTRDSEQRRGVQSTSFKFTPEELALLEEMAGREGGRKAAVIAGLRALERRNEPTDDELLEMLRRRMQGRG